MQGKPVQGQSAAVHGVDPEAVEGKRSARSRPAIIAGGVAWRDPMKEQMTALAQEQTCDFRHEQTRSKAKQALIRKRLESEQTANKKRTDPSGMFSCPPTWA
jgi:hypothetical protein